jgi:hypothetical protein
MTNRSLSVPVIFLEIIYCRFSELAEGPVHAVFIQAVGAWVVTQCYQFLLQVFDELRVF